MAALIFVGKSKCPLCNELIHGAQSLVATTGCFGFNKSHPLWRFQDVAMHQTCFLAWEKRKDFVDQFNLFHEDHFRGMLFMLPNGQIEEREPTRSQASSRRFLLPSGCGDSLPIEQLRKRNFCNGFCNG